jgi:hypothetical protein
MSRYTVTWLKGTENRLIEIWMRTADKQAVTTAANAIDARLAKDPANQGSEVGEGLRSLYVPPLHVLFSVREPDRLVEVVSVRTDEDSAPKSQGNGQAQPTS